ncbi:hypothetical protein VTL71DRAFT_5750 [Oculimacula yallundae]|uniref:Uncharacterized protein n=1 Tax=Oculimacula yallundae TaxID=86028 RepID=A0ABR4C0Y0_9HELO
MSAPAQGSPTPVGFADEYHRLHRRIAELHTHSTAHEKNYHNAWRQNSILEAQVQTLTTRLEQVTKDYNIAFGERAILATNLEVLRDRVQDLTERIIELESMQIVLEEEAEEHRARQIVLESEIQQERAVHAQLLETIENIPLV